MPLPSLRRCSLVTLQHVTDSILLTLKQMSSMFRDNPKPIRLAVTALSDTDAVVKQHLAYSLREVDELRRQGKPISSPSLESQYYDGDINVSSDMLPLDNLRGVDINDMWEESQDKKERLSKARLRSVDVNPSNG